MSVELPDELLDALADRLAARIAKRLPAARDTSPWMTKDEAVAYTRIADGTFRQLAADGRIPSHGGKRRLFNRQEVDAAILADYAPRPRPLRSVS